MEQKKMSNPVWFGIICGLIFAIYMLPVNGAKGDSMLPTMNGSEVCINIRKNPFININRGDIVMVDKTIHGKRHVMQKRVIGLPGDEITIQDDNIFVNGDILEEDYIQGKTSLDKLSDIDIRLTNNQYYILGDNRTDSYDSRYYGAVSKNEVKYKLLFTYKPFFEFRFY